MHADQPRQFNPLAAVDPESAAEVAAVADALVIPGLSDALPAPAKPHQSKPSPGGNHG